MPTSLLRRLTACLAVVLFLGSSLDARAQLDDRVSLNGQELWLSGGNVAWVNFARDIGPGQTNLNAFRQSFESVQDAGGNAMRLWLHTTGEVTPAWSLDSTGLVVGPGDGTIEDLRAILDLAWEHEVGLMLCLWSFDMLQSGRSDAMFANNRALLTDSLLTAAYIENALVPMVDSLAGHPAIIAWEIFNEPEGMTTQFGWTPQRVDMSNIQRFVNQTAGAIHRAAPGVPVTNGSWSFRASSDVLTGQHERNYYSDERLVAAGGDPDGYLDFYTVHYYEWGGTRLSPFHHDADYWGLDKPVVIAEFYLYDDRDYDYYEPRYPTEELAREASLNGTYGVPYGRMYEELYDRGYAGALGWQWFDWWTNRDPEQANWPRVVENVEAIWALYPEAVDVDPGLRILNFTAEPPEIEAGQTSTLAWSVTGATEVTLDDAPVEPSGTYAVAPDTTTTYMLAAADAEGATDTVRVTVSVLDPSQINRARARPVAASTVETCCGPALTADLAVDDDVNTRWSSEWQEGFADEDPDDEWIYVDLGATYDLHEIVLYWEAAYGEDYTVDVSYDGYLWETVREVRGSDGDTDTLRFAEGEEAAARFVRMHGVTRATEWGYSLWEFEVYGLASAVSPPLVAFTAPHEGAFVEPGSDVAVTVDASDADGAVEHVVFHLDGDSLATVDAEPYSVTLPSVAEGVYELTATVADDHGLRVQTAPFTFYATSTEAFRRFEAEEAAYAGSVSAATGGGASGGTYLDMSGSPASGTITFGEIHAPEAGDYLFAFGYNLAYDAPKSQFVVVNGDTLTELRFDGPANTWLERGLEVPLQEGANTLTIDWSWGWMYVDYLAGEGVTSTAAEDDLGLPAAVVLGRSYPNPFTERATVPFALPEAGAVRLEVFDLTGRRVAVLLDGVQPAGSHTVSFEAEGLASGVYVLRLTAGTTVRTQPVVLMR